MNTTRQLQESFVNLLSAKLRSFLAILGILVGTGSVVAMVSSGELAANHALLQFQQLGTDLLAVSVYEETSTHQEGQSNSEQKELTLGDVLTLKNKVIGIHDIAPYTTAFTDINFNGMPLEGSVIGTIASLQQVIHITMREGRFITDYDDRSAFCVIGSDLANDLKQYGIINPLNMQINLGHTIFTIIGVAAPWTENNFFNQDINRSIIIPLGATTLISSSASINNIVMRLNPDVTISPLEKQMTAFFNQQFPAYRLFFRSAQQLIDSMMNQKQTLTLLLALIGSISLLVGGIGVMNIMLVSVVERKREIGIRKAVGATRKDIQWLFLIEAITLTLLGGIIGVILGISFSFIIAKFAGWTFQLFLLPPLVGFLVSAAVGLFFGFYPAYQAARLDPIETLRAD